MGSAQQERTGSKHGTGHQKKHRNISWVCRARTRDGKYPLASALVGNVGSKEDSCRIIGTGGRLREMRVQ